MSLLIHQSGIMQLFFYTNLVQLIANTTKLGLRSRTEVESVYWFVSLSLQKINALIFWNFTLLKHENKAAT